MLCGGERHLVVPLLQSVLLDHCEEDGPEQPTLLAAAGEEVSFSPLDTAVLVDGGKVIGQSSLRVAGQVLSM